MPVFHAGPGQAPPWCEMRQFDIVRLAAGAAPYDFGRAGPREKLIVGEGACTVSAAGRELAAGEGANIDLPAGEQEGGFSILDVAEDATLIRMAGHWGDEVGGSGLFSVEEAADSDRVDPAIRSPTRSGPPSTATSTTATSTGSSSPAAESPSRRGRATRSPQATAWPPAWGTTTTSRSCTSRCGPSTSRPPWRGGGGGGICGTIRMGRRNRGWSGCELGLGRRTRPHWIPK